MRRVILLHPERMFLIFNEAIFSCWNLGKEHIKTAVQQTDKIDTFILIHTLDTWAYLQSCSRHCILDEKTLCSKICGTADLRA